MKYDVFISDSHSDYKDENQNEIPGNVITIIKKLFNDNNITYWIDEENRLHTCSS